VRRVEQPGRKDVGRDFGWLCESLGLAGGKDDLAAEILREIVDAERRGAPVRSITISRKAHVTRGGAVYHLNRLIESGIVVRNGRRYELRGGTLSGTMEEIEGDMLLMMRRMREIARELDEEMGVEARG